MFGKVLVPLDGSGFAEAALPLAAAVARASRAELELVSSYDPVPPVATGDQGVPTMVPVVQPGALDMVPVTAVEVGRSFREDRTTYLREVARRLREHQQIEAEVALLDGRPDLAVMERVEKTGADLVVMATHGRGPVERAWLGSVADRLVRQLRVPVLLVRPVEGEKLDLAATPDVRRVIVPLDGSELAEAVIEPAARLAEVLGVGVTLLRAVGSRPGLQSTYLPHAAQAHHEELEAERKEGTAYLDRVAERVGRAGMNVAERLVVEGSPPHVILDTADPDGGDVVAMATHGRGGLRRLVLGSVSDKVVRAAIGPVLLVRPPEPS